MKNVVHQGSTVVTRTTCARRDLIVMHKSVIWFKLRRLNCFKYYLAISASLLIILRCLIVVTLASDPDKHEQFAAARLTVVNRINLRRNQIDLALVDEIVLNLNRPDGTLEAKFELRVEAKIAGANHATQFPRNVHHWALIN